MFTECLDVFEGSGTLRFYSKYKLHTFKETELGYLFTLLLFNRVLPSHWNSVLKLPMASMVAVVPFPVVSG